jgi:hypothetical protein
MAAFDFLRGDRARDGRFRVQGMILTLRNDSTEL